MATHSELQQRLAVASERNRTNNERREALLAEIKTKFGCTTIEELRKRAEEKRALLTEQNAVEEASRTKAQSAVEVVEVAVGSRT